MSILSHAANESIVTYSLSGEAVVPGALEAVFFEHCMQPKSEPPTSAVDLRSREIPYLPPDQATTHPWTATMCPAYVVVAGQVDSSTRAMRN